MLEYACYRINIDLYQEEELIMQNEDVQTLHIAFSKMSLSLFTDSSL